MTFRFSQYSDTVVMQLNSRLCMFQLVSHAGVSLLLFKGIVHYALDQPAAWNIFRVVEEQNENDISR